MTRRFIALTALLTSLLVAPVQVHAGSVDDAESVLEVSLSEDFTPDDADVLRLYWAFFNREPDVAGAKYWIATADTASLVDIAWGFANSAEFVARYGNTTNERFLEIVYRNVLGRDYDQSGYDYWLDLMHQGLPRHEVVLWVAAGNEFKAAHPYPPPTTGPTPPTAGPARTGCTWWETTRPGYVNVMWAHSTPGQARISSNVFHVLNSAPGGATAGNILPIKPDLVDYLTVETAERDYDCVRIMNPFPTQPPLPRGCTLVGTAGDDTLVGDLAAGEKVCPQDGNDLIVTGSGDDRVEAADSYGNKTIRSGGGRDIIETGPGNDVINSGDGNDQISTGDGNDRIDAGDGDDLIYPGPGHDRINAGDGDDQVTDSSGRRLSSGNDVADLGPGSDIYRDNGGGDDVVTGGTGDDWIELGPGDDIADGGYGLDRLDGGEGDDVLRDAAVGDLGLFGHTVIGGPGNDLAILLDGSPDVFYTEEIQSGVELDVNVCSLTYDLGTVPDDNLWSGSIGCSIGFGGNEIGISSSQDGDITLSATAGTILRTETSQLAGQAGSTDRCICDPPREPFYVLLSDRMR